MQRKLQRLLLIGLDAADPLLIDRWTGDGTLPNLEALRRAGTSGRLASSARYLTGSPWPTLYTGQPPSGHGIYHDFQWRHAEMAFAAPDRSWISATPFWRHLGDDVFAIACDVPMGLGVEPFNGVEISGWAAHDSLAPAESHPADLLAEVRRRFGEWHPAPEAYGPSPVADLLALRDDLIDGTRRSTDLALWLMKEQPWNLAIVGYGALHRGGHRLFSRASIVGPVAEDEGVRFDRCLRDLYVAADQAVGRLVDAAPDATVIAFSAHGMMANTARVDLLDDMLSRVLAGRADATPQRGWMRRLGEAVPLKLRRAVAARTPLAWRNRFMTMWSTGGVAWDKTAAFSLRADLHGYVRINLQGRERCGIVPPASFEELCERITRGLLSFHDASTGEPLIAAVERRDGLYPDGDARDRLPDLIVRWVDTPAETHVAVQSPEFGRVERSTPGRVPDGRSGNHRGEGFLVARGPGIAAGASLSQPADILDLAPTVVRLLGTVTSVPLAGRALPDLTPPS